MGAFSRRPNRKSLSKKHNAGFRFEKCVMLPTSTQINTQTHPFMFFKQFFGFFGHMYMTVPILVIMVHFAARYNAGHRQLVTWLVPTKFSGSDARLSHTTFCDGRKFFNYLFGRILFCRLFIETCSLLGEDGPHWAQHISKVLPVTWRVTCQVHCQKHHKNLKNFPLSRASVMHFN